ncbi:conserved hypothetical protein [Tenacibaculum sp. 190524A05c]|uniref:hypothetical protein n=1 Tax=Tenacibaculum platacis TaxID=3137852 RepID=UPI0031FB3353
MNAYEYGIKQFKTVFQPESNCVIFNNVLKIVGDNEEHTFKPDNATLNDSPNDVYVQLIKSGENTYERLIESKRITTDTVERYLLPNNYASVITENITVENLSAEILQIIKYEDDLYVKVAIGSDVIDVLDEVEFTIKKDNPGVLSPKIFAMPDVKLRNIVENKSIAVVFFFAQDGALLEDAYARINNVQDNEIIFFLESEGSFNPLSVARVKTGVNIKENIDLPYKEVAELAKLFQVKIEIEEVRKIFSNHFENKTEEEVDGITSMFYDFGEYIIEVTGEFLSGLLGDPLVTIGTNLIPKLKIAEERWKYYSDNGEKNKNFAPIIPGFENFIEGLDDQKEKVEEGESLESYIESLKKGITDSINKVKIASLKSYLRDQLDFVFDIIKGVQNLYKSIKKLISDKNTFIFINALFIGVYNSIIEALSGIVTIIGHVLNIPKYLNDKDALPFKAVVRIGMEMLENAFESFFSLFSVKNMALFFLGILKAGKKVLSAVANPGELLSKIADGVTYVATKTDRIGYGIGFAVGFVIEEIITALATGGAKTVGQAFKLTIDGFTKLLSTGKKAARIIIDTPSRFILAFGELFQQLKKLDVGKLMDEFIAWVEQLIKTAKQLAEEAFERLFTNPIARKRMRKAGYIPTSVNGDIITFCPISR